MISIKRTCRISLIENAPPKYMKQNNLARVMAYLSLNNNSYSTETFRLVGFEDVLKVVICQWVFTRMIRGFSTIYWFVIFFSPSFFFVWLASSRQPFYLMATMEATIIGGWDWFIFWVLIGQNNFFLKPGFVKKNKRASQVWMFAWIWNKEVQSDLLIILMYVPTVFARCWNFLFSVLFLFYLFLI